MPPRLPQSHAARVNPQQEVETRGAEVVFTSADSLRTPDSFQPEHLQNRLERTAERDSKLLDLRVDHIKQRLFQVGQIKIK